MATTGVCPQFTKLRVPPRGPWPAAFRNIHEHPVRGQAPGWAQQLPAWPLHSRTSSLVPGHGLHHNQGCVESDLPVLSQQGNFTRLSELAPTPDKWASLVAQTIKNLPAMQESQVNPWVGTILWRRKWEPTPVFLHGESHGQRSLVGYSPWGCKESDMTE